MTATGCLGVADTESQQQVRGASKVHGDIDQSIGVNFYMPFCLKWNNELFYEISFYFRVDFNATMKYIALYSCIQLVHPKMYLLIN